MDIEARFRPTDEYISAQSRPKPYFGAHGAGEIPVLIPNTEVKPSSGDYTATSGKLARCRIIQTRDPNGSLFVSIFLVRLQSVVT